MSIPVREAPPKPPQPGIYARLRVQTMYFGVYYSAWRKLETVDMDDLGDVAGMMAPDAENELRFLSAAPEDRAEQEWVILPAGVLQNSVIRVQVGKGRFR